MCLCDLYLSIISLTKKNNMKKIFNLTWGNIILILILFYFIGDLYKGTLIGLEKGIKNYQVYQSNKKYQEYLQSNEYKLEQMDLEIDRYKRDVEFSKSNYEMKKGYSGLYSKKELDEDKQEYLSKQKTLDSLIEKRKILITNK